MSTTPRKPTLAPKTENLGGRSATRVDLNEMAEEELESTNQTGVAPTLGPNPPQPQNFVPSEQHLSDEAAPEAAPEPPVVGADRPYAPEQQAQNVLKMLKEKLGVRRVEPIDVNVGGMRFTMVKLSDRDAEWAVSNSDENTAHRGASVSSLRTSIVAMSVRAIEGIPLYQVLDIQLPEDQRGKALEIADQLYPPVAVRFAAAAKYLNMLRDEVDDSVCPALYDIYNVQIEEKHAVKVEMDAPFSETPSEKEETQS